jgi:16S rRNA C1402 N4-methylase RsmH
MYLVLHPVRTAYDLDINMIDRYKSNPQLQTGDQTRLKLINNNFTEVLMVPEKFDVLIADLGYSSVHLDERDGFSWKRNTPLDMVYCKDATPCSALVNGS